MCGEFTVGRDAPGSSPRRAEAEVDLEQPGKTANQQASPNQKETGHCYLRNHEQLSDSGPTPCRACAAASFFEIFVPACLRQLERRSEAERQSRSECKDGRKSERGGIHSGGLQKRDVEGFRARDHIRCQIGNGQP